MVTPIFLRKIHGHKIALFLYETVVTHRVKNVLLILLFLTAKVGYCQNPFGIYVGIDGRVKFWESETNLNGHLEDTVIVKCGSETSFEDLRNLRQIDLTLIEAPREIATMQSDSDPSKINDTLRSVLRAHLGDTNFFDWNHILTPVVIDSQYENNPFENKYSDIARGAGLTDSVLLYVKSRLEKHLYQHYGTNETYEASNELYREFSEYDSIVDKVAIYDYLVDRVVFYDYNNLGQLTRVLSYYWNSGVEVDFIQYDKNGNIVYFARESLGTIRKELYFTYNTEMRVIEIMERYSSTSSSNIAPHAYPDIRKVKFSYNQGVVNSKSTLLSNGNWLTCYYEIK